MMPRHVKVSARISHPKVQHGLLSNVRQIVKPGKFCPAGFGLKAGEVEFGSPEFRNISPRRARVLAVTAVLFMIFLLTRRSGLDPDHAAADTARAGTAHTAATTLTIVLAVGFLSGLGDGDPRGSLTRN